MSEETPRQSVILGLFTMIGVAILVATLLTIGTLRPGLGRTLSVTAEFEDVGGLARGDAVWYAGVPVGAVRRVQLGGPRQVDVELAIAAAAGAHIPADVVATVTTEGLIGNPIVSLCAGSAEAGALEPGDMLAVEASVSTDELLASLQDLSEQLTTGEGTLGRLLRDDALYVELERTVAELRAFTRSVHREELPETLTGLVEEVQARVTARDTPFGVLLHDRGAGEDLEDALANLEEGSALLNETLEAAQHNFLLRGYFRKQEREQRRREREGEATVLVPPR